LTIFKAGGGRLTMLLDGRELFHIDRL